MRAGSYQYKFTKEKEGDLLPLDAGELFDRSEGGAFLLIKIEDVSLNCHFFSKEEIEFDLDPRQIIDESKAMILFEFMCNFGQLLGKKVRLTPENLMGTPIFEFSPDTMHLEFVPPQYG